MTTKPSDDPVAKFRASAHAKLTPKRPLMAWKLVLGCVTQAELEELQKLLRKP